MDNQVPSRRKRTSRAEWLKRSTDNLRKNEPHRFVTPSDNVLFIENVANMLGCGVDHVRRIPKHELPVAKIGKRVTFLREDVENYVRRQRSTKILNPGSNAPVTAPLEMQTGEFDPIKSLKDDDL